MSTAAAPRPLLALRALWWLVFLVVLAMYTAGLPDRLGQLVLVLPFRGYWAYLSAGEAAVLAQLGIPIPAYFWALLSAELLLGYTCIIVGALIYWRGGGTPGAILCALMVLALGGSESSFTGSLTRAALHWFWLRQLLQAVGIGVTLVVFYTFPDGRFAPRWTRPLAAIYLTIVLLWACFPDLPFNPMPHASFGRTPLLSVAHFFGWYATGVAALIIRYRRHATPVQRQQMKWAFFGLIFGFTVALSHYGLSALDGVFRIFSGPTSAFLFEFLKHTLYWLGYCIVAITFGFAVLRYRIWDVDRVIRRTLVYTLLSLSLTGAVLLVVLAAQLVLGQLGAQSPTPTIVAATLAAALLFWPLRNRLQDLIDRRFDRTRVDFRSAVIAFGQEIRAIIDLPSLLAALVQRSVELLKISYGAVYIRDATAALQLSADAGLPADTPAALEPALAAQLRPGHALLRPQEDRFPMLLPLLALRDGRREVIGALALGPRRSEQPYTRDDSALLLNLADQAGAAIAVAQLVAAERELAAYRASPAGRAEAQAAAIARQDVAAAIATIQSLAERARADADAAQDLELLPPALRRAGLPALADLAEGYRYLAADTGDGALADVGLRMVAAALPRLAAPALADRFQLLIAARAAESPAAIGALGPTLDALLLEEGQAAHPRSPTPLPPGGRSSLLHQEAKSPPSPPVGEGGWGEEGHADESPRSRTRERGTGGEGHGPPSNAVDPQGERGFLLSPLSATLRPVAHALAALPRLDSPAQQLDCLERALALVHEAADRIGAARAPRAVEGMPAERAPPVTGATEPHSSLQPSAFSLQPLSLILRHWQNLIGAAIDQLRGRPELELRLITGHVIADSQTHALIGFELLNRGLGPARGVRIELLPDPSFVPLAAIPPVPDLTPGSSHRVSVPVAPVGPTVHIDLRLSYGQAGSAAPPRSLSFPVAVLAAPPWVTPLPNPYLAGRPLQPDSPVFVGRDSDLALIARALSRPEPIPLILTGQRRMGKTTLLRRLGPHLAPDAATVYLDGQILGIDGGTPQLYLDLASRIARTLGIAAPAPDHMGSQPGAHLLGVLLPQAVAAAGGRRLVLLIDEIEAIEERIAAGRLDGAFFGLLRHLMQHEPRLAIICAGAHRLDALLPTLGAGIFNAALHHRLGGIAPADARRLLTAPLGDRLRYDDLALDTVLRLSGGHPYFLQLLGQLIVDQANDDRRGVVLPAHAQAAAEQTLELGEAPLADLWHDSDPSERLALAALAHLAAPGAYRSAEELAQPLAAQRPPARRADLEHGLQQLARRDILHRRETPAGAAYAWRLALLGHWVARTQSLSLEG